MIRALLICSLAFLCALPAQAGNKGLPEEVSSFLGTRKLLGTVYFASDSAALQPAALVELDLLAGLLASPAQSPGVVRIEGFAARGENAAADFDLALQRAKSVGLYLQETRHIGRTLSLAGGEPRPGDRLPDEKKQRVEVVLYDNLLNIDAAPVDKIINRW